eukprot:750386-Hanusia_phi.AAC.10
MFSIISLRRTSKAPHLGSSFVSPSGSTPLPLRRPLHSLLFKIPSYSFTTPLLCCPFRSSNSFPSSSSSSSALHSSPSSFLCAPFRKTENECRLLGGLVGGGVGVESFSSTAQDGSYVPCGKCEQGMPMTVGGRGGEGEGRDKLQWISISDNSGKR